MRQVAHPLGLHVKTVRGYMRDGRLKASGSASSQTQPILDFLRG